MAQIINSCGGVMWWNFCHQHQDGLALPQTGQFTAYVPIVSGDEGQVFPSNIWNDTPIQVLIWISIFYFDPGADVWPNYTGYGGLQRAGQLGLRPMDSTLADTLFGPALGTHGPQGEWDRWPGATQITAFYETHWAANHRPRFIPSYYDTGIKPSTTPGLETFVIKSMRLEWVVRA